MDTETIMQLINALDHTGWKTFEIEDNGFHLKIERDLLGGTPAPVAVVQPSSVVPATVSAPAPAPAAAQAGVKEITSPLVGIFHQVDEDNPVKAGEVYQKGQPICLIEAMKLMNEINMPEDGEITYIAVETNDTVEFGQVLMQYRPV